jgi:hypothetical protein
MNDWETKYVEVHSETIFRAVERALNPDFVQRHEVSDLLRTSDGKWLIVVSPSIYRRMADDEAAARAANTSTAGQP